MLRVTGEQGELWLVGDPVTLTVPLTSKNGWEWVPADPYRWWDACHEVRCFTEQVSPESVSVPAARVTTGRCLRGSSLTARVTLRPLSLLLVAEAWELVVETELSAPTLGYGQKMERGATGASLRGLPLNMAVGLPEGSEALLARLRHGEMAFQGVCSASGTDVVELRFPDGVDYSGFA